MPDIFLSYSREDAAQAEQLATALQSFGYDCWWDRELVSGVRFLVETENQLKASKAVLVIWSKASVTSHWVADEAAVGRDENRLVALTYDGSMPPLGFRQFQVTDFAAWRGGVDEYPFRSLLRGLERLVTSARSVSAADTGRPRGNLPLRLEPLVGRDAELAEIEDLLACGRLLTLTGPGGIGKTRLALEAARGAHGNLEDGVWVVELAGASDPSDLLRIVAQALGIETRTNPELEIPQRLQRWRALLVLDNCEHLVEAAAMLAERILQQAPEVRILATSQEILGLEGERVLRLKSLSEADAEILFMRRARSADPSFSLLGTEADAIRAICACIDYIPLAIEMAAARAPVLGTATLLAGLTDRFRVLTAGRRTALPRQRTLQATLDWSHALLNGYEALVFRRLAVFAGGCTMEAVFAVASDGACDERMTEDAMASLVAKSLIVVDRSGPFLRYRLLETMRAYSQQKLLEAGETRDTRRRHALYMREFLAPALDGFLGNSEQAVRRFGPEIDNLRAALEWAFDIEGDSTLAVTLVANGFICFDRYRETLVWVERALGCDGEPNAAVKARLVAGRAFASVLAFVANRELVDDSEQSVPESADRVARTLMLMTSALTSELYSRSRSLEQIKNEIARLGWSSTSSATVFVDFCALMALSAANPLDAAQLRAQTDEFLGLARRNGLGNMFHLGCSRGNATEVPWEDDVDRAIVAAQAILESALQSSVVIHRAIGLGDLCGRLVFALCERAGPNDLDNARDLCVRVERRFGLVGPMQGYSLPVLAAAAGRPRDGARLVGWMSTFPAAPYVLKLSHVRRAHDRIAQALPEEEFVSAMTEGARMSSQEAFVLAISN